jgi:hypothetical protein
MENRTRSQGSSALRRDVNAAIRKVFDEPGTFVGILAESADVSQAVSTIAKTYGLDHFFAESIVFQQCRLLIPSERAALDD